MKQNNLFIIAVIAIVAIAGISAFAISANNHGSMMDGDMMSQDVAEQAPTAGPADTNSREYKMYNRLSGDQYDRMFIAHMITHHQGAVDMANLALANAKHQQLKDLAQEIIAAQTREITDMQNWQKAWGYPESSGDMMMDHSAMGMMDDMTDDLRGLSGDAFDKAFLAAMISHHQGGIDMAYPGRINAKHEEVKKLTIAIVDAQAKEITLMKQWQRDWGY